MMSNDRKKQAPKDPDLRSSEAALLRAAERARERARRTHTRLVVSRAGKVEYINVNPAAVGEDREDYDPHG
jgi:hypothetical protein